MRERTSFLVKRFTTVYCLLLSQEGSLIDFPGRNRLRHLPRSSLTSLWGELDRSHSTQDYRMTFFCPCKETLSEFFYYDRQMKIFYVDSKKSPFRIQDSSRLLTILFFVIFTCIRYSTLHKTIYFSILKKFIEILYTTKKINFSKKTPIHRITMKKHDSYLSIDSAKIYSARLQKQIFYPPWSPSYSIMLNRSILHLDEWFLLNRMMIRNLIKRSE